MDTLPVAVEDDQCVSSSKDCIDLTNGMLLGYWWITVSSAKQLISVLPHLSAKAIRASSQSTKPDPSDPIGSAPPVHHEKADADLRDEPSDQDGEELGSMQSPLVELPPPSAPLCIVCAWTQTFRGITSAILLPRDIVLEIGSSYGTATACMAKAVGDPGRVVGIETSRELFFEAQERYPGLRFLHFDAIIHPERIIPIVDEMKASYGANGTAPRLIVFLDIGGNRDLESLSILLPWVLCTLQPAICVLKSEKVARLSRQALVRGKWLSDAFDTFAARPPNSRYAAVRYTPEGEYMCRFHNYDKLGCKKHEDPKSYCPFNHTHCMHCGQFGHRAIGCSELCNIWPHPLPHLRPDAASQEECGGQPDETDS